MNVQERQVVNNMETVEKLNKQEEKIFALIISKRYSS